jgi:hypothetical protein
MKIFIGGGVKTKPILQKEWAFCFLWFCLNQGAPQTGWSSERPLRYALCALRDVGYGLQNN